jgi:hypothetical protein
MKFFLLIAIHIISSSYRSQGLNKKKNSYDDDKIYCIFIFVELPKGCHLRHTKALLINYHHEVHTHVQGKMIAELSLHILMQLHKRVFIRTKLSLILLWSSLIGLAVILGSVVGILLSPHHLFADY